MAGVSRLRLSLFEPEQSAEKLHVCIRMLTTLLHQRLQAANANFKFVAIGVKEVKGIAFAAIALSFGHALLH